MISVAYAADAAPAAGGGLVSLLITFVPLLAIFYFLLWRPQSKRLKAHKDLMSQVAVGDEVVINGGVLGKINKVTEEYVVVEVANGVELNVQKHAVTATLPKGTIKNIK